MDEVKVFPAEVYHKALSDDKFFDNSLNVMGMTGDEVAELRKQVDKYKYEQMYEDENDNLKKSKIQFWSGFFS